MPQPTPVTETESAGNPARKEARRREGIPDEYADREHAGEDVLAAIGAVLSIARHMLGSGG